VATGRSLLEKEGPDSLSLRAVARAAGVSQTAPYRHFKNKEALLADIARVGFEEFSMALRDGVDGVPTLKTTGPLQAMALGYVDFACSNPEVFTLMFGSLIADKSAYPDLVETSRDSFDQLQQAVEKRLQSDDGQDYPVDTGALAAWSLVHGLATLMIHNGVGPKAPSKPERAAFVATISQVLETGLGR
jgi:AcrR family transcriptional regulator